MIRLLLDADLPRSACLALRQRGFVAADVRDIGLGAATDDAILRHATRHGYTLVSADKGFTHLLRFPLGSHHGIIVVRFPPHTPAARKTRLLLRWIPTIEEEDLVGSLLIIQAKGVRMRRPKGGSSK